MEDWMGDMSEERLEIARKKNVESYDITNSIYKWGLKSQDTLWSS